MTQAETRGRGKPRAYDEDELLARVSSVDDVVRIREALVANGEGPFFARQLCNWLLMKFNGDETGGGVSRPAVGRYRVALARLPKDPLKGSGRRRSARNTRGSVQIGLVRTGSAVGALAMAAAAHPEALNFAVRAISHVPPIMPHTREASPVEELSAAA